jgi:3-hydroxyacyl-CoA dehydrogenase
LSSIENLSRPCRDKHQVVHFINHNKDIMVFKPIKKVGVIGAGVMGAAIAAHMANCGLEVILLDMVPGGLKPDLKSCPDTNKRQEMRSILAQEGLNKALNSKPASFYVPEDAELIQVGNLEDHICRMAEVDWVVEAVIERLDIKRQILQDLHSACNPETLITTNTSGLSLAQISQGLPRDFQRRFFCTHFFNPPRYLKLLELVPGPGTEPDILNGFAGFAEEVLGKGVVWAKDTPNFIANRIGVFSGCLTYHLMEDLGLSIEEVDAITGPNLGRPNTASFRLADLVGLDVFAHVARNVYETCPEDERHEVFKLPKWFADMVDQGLLGLKSGAGFYKKAWDEKGRRCIMVLNMETMDYRPMQKPVMPVLDQIKRLKSAREKVRALYYSDDQAGRFIFRLISETLLYSARRIPEICNDLVNLDNAMKWGFGWGLGPFETWDALGLEKSSQLMTRAGYEIPAWVQGMLANGKDSFYLSRQGQTSYFDLATDDYTEPKTSPLIIHLAALKERERIIMSNKEASLIDLGDGVACLEFHSKMNSFGAGIVSMLDKACDYVSRECQGLVIANQGKNFSVGANLSLVLFTAQEGDWDELEAVVRKFQNTFMRMKYLDKPVVAAPHQMALGGGCELLMHCDMVVAAAETYTGLVEVGVGVIPSGGGSKELLLRNTHQRIFKVAKGGVYGGQINLLPFVAKAFETIALAKVSTSAKEAFGLSYLKPGDKVEINPEFRIQRAKDAVLGLSLMGYQPPTPVNKVRVMGRDAKGTLDYAVYNLRQAGYATEHDLVVAGMLARVLTGGDVLKDTEVSESYLLDLEREAFLSLCGTKATQDRMAHMLKTGKPLRN